MISLFILNGKDCFSWTGIRIFDPCSDYSSSQNNQDWKESLTHFPVCIRDDLLKLHPFAAPILNDPMIWLQLCLSPPKLWLFSFKFLRGDISRRWFHCHNPTWMTRLCCHLENSPMIKVQVATWQWPYWILMSKYLGSARNVPNNSKLVCHLPAKCSPLLAKGTIKDI